MTITKVHGREVLDSRGNPTVEVDLSAGTAFGRVVPNFVDQQNAIRQTGRLRDEVNRRGLLANNLSWASAGLDTGRPGYTLGTTPPACSDRVTSRCSGSSHLRIVWPMYGVRPRPPPTSTRKPILPLSSYCACRPTSCT